MELKVIAKMKSDFSEKFGIPRQSGLVSQLESTIVFEKGYDSPEALRGLEAFSHIWLIWGFSESGEKWSDTVRPPRLGGNERMGVFATRSPFRPNPLALSCVKILSIEPGEIRVSGADLMDGTPIYDIKPYIPYADSIPEAIGGFARTAPEAKLKVEIPPALLERIAEGKREALVGVLAQDPRPSYVEESPRREFGLSFAGVNVRFIVDGGVVRVLAVEQHDL
ncbi:tRNA (N6-threonylcarbamoyladenosine(37)-N6)-methyltransferase TrmO [Clostridiaceae bacterium OttesenSCG-928-D20]|nr:tRNA (N6-threonylcarbamoyladenosine(37)-N6)-methyltransferase TrmO [Clostridiaceae bacterium OttesenSCG-928-D20]